MWGSNYDFSIAQYQSIKISLLMKKDHIKKKDIRRLYKRDKKKLIKEPQQSTFVVRQDQNRLKYVPLCKND